MGRVWPPSRRLEIAARQLKSEHADIGVRQEKTGGRQARHHVILFSNKHTKLKLLLTKYFTHPLIVKRLTFQHENTVNRLPFLHFLTLRL